MSTPHASTSRGVVGGRHQLPGWHSLSLHPVRMVHPVNKRDLLQAPQIGSLQRLPWLMAILLSTTDATDYPTFPVSGTGPGGGQHAVCRYLGQVPSITPAPSSVVGTVASGPSLPTWQPPSLPSISCLLHDARHPYRHGHGHEVDPDRCDSAITERSPNTGCCIRVPSVRAPPQHDARTGTVGDAFGLASQLFPANNTGVPFPDPPDPRTELGRAHADH